MKLSGKLPKVDANGLVPISERMVADPERVWAVVALVDCQSTTTVYGAGDVIPTARIRHIEVVLTPEHIDMVKRVMSSTMLQRTGREVLPITLEDELIDAFKGIQLDGIGTVDPNTGEVIDPEGQQ